MGVMGVMGSGTLSHFSLKIAGFGKEETATRAGASREFSKDRPAKMRLV
jgi:hypothetical protein